MLLAAQLVALAWPAYACGCGGMVPGDRSRIAVEQESSVVGWDGRTEQILMSLTVGGDAEEAAWIMPVPHRATVRLGDSRVFAQLNRLMAPELRERHYFWPRPGDWPFADSGGVAASEDGAPKSPVKVVGRERLGPFDVARLTATDPEALRGWLRDNGFALPDRLADELSPYVEREWEYVAVRLAPGSRDEGDVLDGTLDPLHLTFASDKLVYPMRLSRAASLPQRLGLYVLAPHRMRPSSAIGGDEPKLRFAGRLDEPPGAVRRFAGGAAEKGVFLTVYNQYFPVPERISGDHQLRRAHSDSAFRPVIDDDDLLTWGGVPAWVVTLLAALAAVAVCVRRWSRRRRHP
ncbi:MAG TPA: DUF2330 domain-containing protein [Streptomyces sp.]|nr:DUF2330 domain-containing protein [Streptomyces sp.]